MKRLQFIATFFAVSAAASMAFAGMRIPVTTATPTPPPAIDESMSNPVSQPTPMSPNTESPNTFLPPVIGETTPCVEKTFFIHTDARAFGMLNDQEYHVTVPAFSSSRPSVRVKLELVIVSVAPGAMSVRPLPLIVPLVQKASP